MGARQGVLFGTATGSPAASGKPSARALARELRAFDRFGTATVLRRTSASDGSCEVDTFVNEFWTARQRAASSLHEVSYRACFKPALPRFFVERLTAPGDVVHDPFLGRGTTAIETALLGRVPVGCDVNPLTRVLAEPRLRPPRLEDVAARLSEIDLTIDAGAPDELLVFFHPDTLGAIAALRAWLCARDAAGELDDVDRWIRMVAVNRLTGHSAGFFSVYTLPPNQAVSVEAQRKINLKRGQEPPFRDVQKLILRKTKSLLRDVDDAVRDTLAGVAERARILTAPGDATPEIRSGSVALVVTSPPFLDVVQYAADNWLRCWFCGVDPDTVAITHARRIEEWEAAMTSVMRELRRVLRPGGHVAFEVGEVRGGKVELERHVLTCAVLSGLRPQWVLIQDQEFTKTANCWGVSNNRRGTNTNRVVLLRKSE